MIDLPCMLFKHMDKPIDALVKQFVNYDVVAKSIPIEKKFFLSTKPPKDPIEFISTMLGAIHSRASAAISHISIMVGVTILLMIRIQPFTLIKFFMIGEIVIYSLLLLLCLRCVRSMTLNDGRCYELGELDYAYEREIINRFAALQFINFGLVVATLIFLTLIVVYGIAV